MSFDFNNFFHINSSEYLPHTKQLLHSFNNYHGEQSEMSEAYKIHYSKIFSDILKMETIGELLETLETLVTLERMGELLNRCDLGLETMETLERIGELHNRCDLGL